MRYRVQMHESVFSDSLFRSLLEEPIIDGLPTAVALPVELEGLGPGEPAAAAAAVADDGDDADDDDDDVAEAAAV